MANDCWYQMSAVGSKEDLERLISIMKYEDPKLYIYRVFSVEICSDIKPTGDGRYIAYLSGDVAWSISSWLNDIPYVTGDGRLYVSLRFLSDLLHIDFEIQSEESGCAFQQHCAIVDGKITLYEDCYWFELYYDDDYDDPNEIIEDIDEILDKYQDLKALFDDKTYAEMCDEIRKMFDWYEYVSVDIGGYGRDRSVDDDVVDKHVESWKPIPYHVVC